MFISFNCNVNNIVYICNMKDIEVNIKNQGRSKTWLMSQLGISRRTFYERMKDNSWRPEELMKLRNLNLVG